MVSICRLRVAAYGENGDLGRENAALGLRRRAMGRQMYFYYLEWLFVYNQNKYGRM